MTLSPGTRLDAYEIVRPIGAGGMGEVYLARDTALGREVAIKILGRGQAVNEAVLGRFEREGRLLAALNHPNIAVIHGVGSCRGLPYLALEYVPGPTLAERFTGEGPLPWKDVVEVGLQIAAALEAAHDRGIVHRDLKPANIKVRPDGRVSVLDFGLAKELFAAEPLSGPEPDTLQMTREGTVLGTPAYMSPEQVRGRSADRRSDLWALGCILFEGLAGRPAFGGETAADLMVAVLERDPAWEALPGTIPGPLRNLLTLCLAKSPEERLQSAGEARRELLRARRDRGKAGAEEPSGSGWWRRVPGWMGAAVSAFSRRESPATPAARTTTDVPPREEMRFHLSQETFTESIESSPAWSPQGDAIVFCAEVGGLRRLFRKTVGEGTAEAITSGDHDDIQPFWAPDGDILFVRACRPGHRLEPGDVFGSYTDGNVWTLDPASGEARLLVEDAYNPSVSPDGSKIAVDASRAGPRRIWILDRHGHNPVQATSDTSEAVMHLRPRWSPDGRRLVFQTFERPQFNVRVVDLSTREVHPLIHDLSQNVHPVWCPTGGRIYFSSYRGGGINLWRAPVDAAGRPAGSLQQITTGAGQDLEAAPAGDGRRLAFSILRQNAELWRLPVDPGSGEPQGPPQKVVATTREDSRGAWSPDGTRIAFNSDRTGEMNLWLADSEGGPARQVTRGPGGDYQANWSADAAELAFFSSRSGSPGIWKVALGDGRLTPLSPPGCIEINPCFSPDGSRLAYHSDRDGRFEVWLMDREGKDPRQLTRIGAMGHFLRWSRDGRFVFFRSGGGPRPGVYRVPATGGEPEPLPVKGGSHLSLSPDERHVMDVLDHRVLWVSPLEGGEPRPVFEHSDPETRIDYPVWSPDGRWVLFDRFRPKGGDIWMLEPST